MFKAVLDGSECFWHIVVAIKGQSKEPIPKSLIYNFLENEGQKTVQCVLLFFRVQGQPMFFFFFFPKDNFEGVFLMF